MHTIKSWWQQQVDNKVLAGRMSVMKAFGTLESDGMSQSRSSAIFRAFGEGGSPLSFKFPSQQ